MLRTLIISGLISITLIACGGDGGGSNNLPQAELVLPAIQGDSEVGYTRFTITDASRANRELVVDAWYPVDDIDFRAEPAAFYSLLPPFSIASDVAGDNLPVSQQANRKLIVYSHGSNGLPLESFRVMETLASQGFIVVAPAHTGNTLIDPPGAQRGNRVTDISFVIDEMLGRSATSGDIFEGRISSTDIGVTGQSAGGRTAMGMAVGLADANADPRVTAILPISGAFLGNVTEAQFKSLAIPTLLLVGTLDEVVNVEVGRNAFATIDNSPTFSVEIIGAGHEHFTIICDIADLLSDNNFTFAQLAAFLPGSEVLEIYFNRTCVPDVFSVDETVRIQTIYSVAFFKTYLESDVSFDDYLTSTYADSNEPDVNFDQK
jgi:dienelactone hydrolase